MASPAEIIARHDARAAAARAGATNDEPTGFIRIDGKMVAFWLPDGVTPEAIGLKSWSKTRRWVS